MPATLTSRERLRRCYWHEELDRPGVYSRRGFPDDDPTYDRLRRLIDEQTDVKLAWGTAHLVSRPAIDQRREPYSDDFERSITTLHTPAGDLERTYLHSTKGQPGLHETFLIKDEKDVETYLSMPMPTVAGETESFLEMDRQLGDRGIVEVSSFFNPGGWAAEQMGSESFAIMSATNREAIHALCERRMREILDVIDFLIERGVGPCFGLLGEEYIVPPLHGKQDFDEFNTRYDKPIVDRIHEAGGRVHLHSHGRVKQVFAGFLDIGCDVLHPFEGPPMGDITPAEAKAIAGERICLEGNIQIGEMYRQTPEWVREQTEQLIADCFADRKNLIVSPTASPYIRGQGEEAYQRYATMIDVVLNWKA